MHSDGRGREARRHPRRRRPLRGARQAAGAREPLLAAEALTAEHGLGASTVAQEKTVVRATIAQVRERLATWEIVLPAVEHPELGRA